MLYIEISWTKTASKKTTQTNIVDSSTHFLKWHYTNMMTFLFLFFAYKFAAPLVKFSPLSEMDRNKFVEIGNPIVLYCELSDPAAAVHWYKNGVELQTMEGLHIQSEGTMRRIVIQSAEFSHSGIYCCDAIDDVIRFNVEVEGKCCVSYWCLSRTNHL